MLQQVARALLNGADGDGPAVPGPREAPSRSTVVAPPPDAVVPVRAGRHVVRTAFPHGDVLLTVHVAPIELVTGVDVLVSSENIYFEMSKTFRRTVSGSLRRAGATTDSVGRITDDVIARQLASWVRTFGVPGLPVAAPDRTNRHDRPNRWQGKVSDPAPSRSRAVHPAPASRSPLRRAGPSGWSGAGWRLRPPPWEAVATAAVWKGRCAFFCSKAQ